MSKLYVDMIKETRESIRELDDFIVYSLERSTNCNVGFEDIYKRMAEAGKEMLENEKKFLKHLEKNHRKVRHEIIKKEHQKDKEQQTQATLSKESL